MMKKKGGVTMLYRTTVRYWVEAETPEEAARLGLSEIRNPDEDLSVLVHDANMQGPAERDSLQERSADVFASGDFA